MELRTCIQDDGETESARSELKHIRNRKNFHDILRRLDLNLEFEVKKSISSITRLDFTNLSQYLQTAVKDLRLKMVEKLKVSFG